MQATTIVLDGEWSRLLVDPAGPDPPANHNSTSLAVEKQRAGDQDHAIPPDLAFQGSVPIYQEDAESPGLLNTDSLWLHKGPAFREKRHGHLHRTQVLIDLIPVQDRRFRIERDKGSIEGGDLVTGLGTRGVSIELNRRRTRQRSSVHDRWQAAYHSTAVMAIDRD